jgi:hypothetical protein
VRVTRALSRVEAVVERALAHVARGEPAIVAATPAMPVGEIAATVRRLAEELDLPIAIEAEPTNVVVHPRPRTAA